MTGVDHSMQTLDRTMEQIAPAGHTASVISLGIAWANAFGPIITVLASLFTLFWVTICIWESSTCKGWRLALHHWSVGRIMKKRGRLLAKLKARELKTQASILALEMKRAGRVAAREVLATAAVQAATVVAHEPVETASKIPPAV